jgi:hypothetical protein
MLGDADCDRSRARLRGFRRSAAVGNTKIHLTPSSSPRFLAPEWSSSSSASPNIPHGLRHGFNQQRRQELWWTILSEQRGWRVMGIAGRMRTEKWWSTVIPRFL